MTRRTEQNVLQDFGTELPHESGSEVRAELNENYLQDRAKWVRG